MSTTLESPKESAAAPQPSHTVNLFTAGMEYVAQWHEREAAREEERGWTERAKDHRYHAEDIRTLIKKVQNP